MTLTAPLARFFDKTAEIKRHGWSGAPGDTDRVTTLASVATGVKCFLRPLTEAEASTGGFKFGQTTALHVNIDVDIQEGDTVTISLQDYTVQGVADHNRGSFPFKRCIIIRPEKP